MPPLDNPKHEAFAHAMALGKKLAEALELANYKPHPSSGARLLKDAKISERIAQIRERIANERESAAIELAKKEELTKAWVIDRLMQNARIAMGEQKVKITKKDGEEIEVIDRDVSGANKALELLGKEVGLFIDRKEVGKPGEFAELEELSDAELADIARGRGNGITASENGAQGSSKLH